MNEKNVLNYLSGELTKEKVVIKNQLYEHNCAYLRKSRLDTEAEARGENVLERHRQMLLELAQRMGTKIDKFYEEVVSGESIAQRTEMQKLISDVETGYWDSVFVVEVERLARGNTREQGLVAEVFKYSDTKIVTPMKTYNPSDSQDEEYFEFGLFMSRREYKTINRRLSAGRIASIKEGKYVGNIPPYGYYRKKLEDSKGFILVPNSEEAPTVKYIFEQYANTDISINALATLLNTMGLKPRKGNEWTLSAVRDILANPVYVGILRWNRRKAVKKCIDGEISISRPRNHGEDVIYCEGLHEHLISDEIFLLAEEKRKKVQKPITSIRTLKNPFAGLLYCEKCGKLLVRKPYRDKQKDTSLICTTPGCTNISSKFMYVEEKIILILKEILESYSLDGAEDCQFIKDEALRLEGIKKVKEHEVETQRKKLEKVFDAYEEGIYDKGAFIERSQKLNKEIQNIEKSIQDIDSQLNAIEHKAIEYSEFYPKIANALEFYHSDLVSTEKKNQMLSEVIEKITYIKTEKAIKKGSNPYNFAIDVFMKFPWQ